MDKMPIVLVGDDGVGKTSLIATICNDRFPETPHITQSPLSVTHMVGDEAWTVEFWDTIGNEEYDRLRPLTYPGKMIALACFSVASPTSFENVMEKWVPEVRHHVPDIIFVVVGLQVDLREGVGEEAVEARARLASRRQKPVRREDGEAMAAQLGAVRYIECSARSGYKMNSVLRDVVETGILSPQARQRKKSCVIM